MKKGDIVLISFPFSDLSGSKLRPALVLISTESDVTVCFITTQFNWNDDLDITLIPSSENGLKRISLLRIGKFATLDSNLVLGRIGSLERQYLKILNHNLIKLLQLDS